MSRKRRRQTLAALALVAALAWVALAFRGDAPAALDGDGVGRGYAGLGEAADPGFALPERGRTIAFPDDLGAHPAFRIEWWYVTANLNGEDGRTYGVQWTLFRQALAPDPQREGWASQQFWLGHAALTAADRHYYAERLARGGVGQAGVEVASAPGSTVPGEVFSAWIDHWSLSGFRDEEADADKGEGEGEGAGATPTRYAVSADGDGFRYALDLTTDRAFALQGEAGYSVKSDRGQASHYYSQPFLQARGEIVVEGETIAVDGLAWMDREWSSQPLAPEQQGWDWFSLHLDDGDKVMLYRLRDAEGRNYVSGNWIASDGTNQLLSRDDVGMGPTAWTWIDGRRAPTSWLISIRGRGFEVAVEPINARSWNSGGFAYWEGPIRVQGSHSGVGYLEMTGY